MMSQYRTKLLLLSHNFSNVMINNTSLNEAHYDHGNENGNFSSWLGLTEHAVEKHLSKSTSTTKGHLNQQRQNARTTKIKDAQVIEEPTIDHGVKTQFVYAATIDAGLIRKISRGFEQRQQIHHDIV
jgi:hypothetical protein